MRHQRIRSGGPAVGVAAVLAAIVCCVGVATAIAAPTIGPSDNSFYTPPSPLPSGPPGTLIWYRPTTVDLGPAMPSVQAWNVLYLSTDVNGNPFPVTGTVTVPTAPWTGSGERPVIDYAYATQGLAQRCAPSFLLNAGTEYDGGATLASLQKGYAVVSTDYRGYTTDGKPTYIAGNDEGDSVLDAQRAAAQIPDSGVALNAPTFIWGYSQGGGAASWAGELQPTYAPEIDLQGVAAGGVPADLVALNNFANGSVDSAFVMYGIIGLLNQSPEIKPSGLLNPAGLAYVAKLEGDCALQDIGPPNSDQDNDQYLNNPLSALLANPTFLSIIQANDVGTPPIPVPYFQYSGEFDEFVPLTAQVALKQQECSEGVTDDYHLYDSDHLLTDPAAVPDVLTWIGNLLAGQPAPSTCNIDEPLPAGARTTPETGDLVIPLNNWLVGGSLKLKKLGLTVPIPPVGTINASADLTSGSFSGTTNLPPVTDTMKILGIPISATVQLTLTAPLTGTVALNDSTGVLSISGSGSANMTIKSTSIGPLTIPIGCHTSSPLALALNVSSAVGEQVGSTFSTSSTVTIPSLTGCGILGPILSLFISGPSNPITLNISEPPATPF